MEDSQGGAIQKSSGQSIRIDPSNLGAGFIELSGLTQEAQQALVADYVRGTLDVQKKAAQMNVDVTAFRNMLDVMSSKTKEIAEQEGTSVTMQHTQESSVGRTEVIMGNTAQAASGRLTRTMANDRNMVPLYIGLGIVAILVLVAMFLRH